MKTSLRLNHPVRFWIIAILYSVGATIWLWNEPAQLGRHAQPVMVVGAACVLFSEFFSKIGAGLLWGGGSFLNLIAQLVPSRKIESEPAELP